MIIDEHNKENKTQLFMICFNIIFVMAGLGIIAPALSQIQAWQGANFSLMGIFVSAFSLGRILIDIPAGLLIDKWKPQTVAGIGLGITAAGSLMAALSPNFMFLVCSRFITGIGSGMAVTSLQSALILIAPPSCSSRYMSYFVMSRKAGSSLFPFIGGLLAEWFGWRSIFFFCFLLNMFGVLISMFSKAKYSQGEIHRNIKEDKGEKAETEVTCFKHKLVKKSLLAIYLATFAIYLNREGLEKTVIPLFGDMLSFSPAQIGFALTSASLVSMPGIYYGVKAADCWGRKRVLLGGLAITIIGNLLFLTVNSYYVYLIINVLYGAAAFNIALPNIMVTDLVPREKTGQKFGMIRFFVDLGQATGPLVLTAIIDKLNIYSTFIININLILGVFLIVLFMLSETSKVKRQQTDLYKHN